MPTERIAGPPNEWLWKDCKDPDHNPPMMRVFDPGTYKHTCPSCGKATVFTVPRLPTMKRI